MADELTQLVSRYGALMVFVSVLLEQLGLPIPSLPTLIAAGAIAALGHLHVIELLLAAIIGSVIADVSWYAVGCATAFEPCEYCAGCR